MCIQVVIYISNESACAEHDWITAIVDDKADATEQEVFMRVFSNPTVIAILPKEGEAISLLLSEIASAFHASP